MGTITFARECTAHFLDEQRTELYAQYCAGAAQSKNALCATNGLQDQTWSDLERRGA